MFSVVCEDAATGRRAAIRHGPRARRADTTVNIEISRALEQSDRPTAAAACARWAPPDAARRDSKKTRLGTVTAYSVFSISPPLARTYATRALAKRDELNN
ncbi:hypothetical protein EVAR_12049_1 [Eumeta japonica]|uniref:Uncharacterized protein n=1 Tax=Eumeta variegata TaxID=151549 RepID=A0A4C1U5A6_EUMVA|nr:hypothetical protein EVAR_12049_1 [Eumeta japonica]